MIIRILRTEKEYDIALDRLYELIESDVPSDSEEFAEMEALALLINHYENKQVQVRELPLPELIKNHLLNRGMKITIEKIANSD